jgi:hypothetical protein
MNSYVCGESISAGIEMIDAEDKALVLLESGVDEGIFVSLETVKRSDGREAKVGGGL